MKLSNFAFALVALALCGEDVSAQTFSILHSFTNGSDGSTVVAGLVSSSNTLYGTARDGGSEGHGTVFKVNADGTGFTTLYSFSNSVGADPYAGLVLSGNVLYGTTSYGGGGGYGTVFKINTEGTGFVTVYRFNSDGSDGGYTQAGLVLSSNQLYGTTTELGAGLEGTVFRANTDGTGFTILYSFPQRSWSGNANTNTGGACPQAALVLSGNALYGTASSGGSAGGGTVFKVNTDGTAFATLHSFTATGPFTNSDGASPHAGLIVSGNTLYGTASRGGSAGQGTVFKVLTDGTGFTPLYRLRTAIDGGFPRAGLILSGGTLYGTTPLGGVAGHGTVFALSPAPPIPIPLDAQLIGGALVVSWLNPSFALQTAPAVAGPFTNIPSAASPHTNSVANGQAFFRLRAN